MQINDTGLSLIKSFEGCKLKAYRDIVGILTIGYGHTGNVSDGMEIDQEAANALLMSDLKRFEEGVEALVTTPINDNQASALICFAFNVGLHNLSHSHLLYHVNAKEWTQAADAFLNWNHAAGVVIPGLTRRREAERLLFLS